MDIDCGQPVLNISGQMVAEKLYGWPFPGVCSCLNSHPAGVVAHSYTSAGTGRAVGTRSPSHFLASIDYFNWENYAPVAGEDMS